MNGWTERLKSQAHSNLAFVFILEFLFISPGIYWLLVSNVIVRSMHSTAHVVYVDDTTLN